MALSRQQKEQILEGYQGGMANAPHAFLIGFEGITVNQVTGLRAKVRENGGEYVVVKNTLARRAVQGAPMQVLEDLFEGPVAVVFSQDDPVGLAKALTQYAKDIPALQVRGGLVDGQRVEAGQVKDIANLPSREELIAKLLFLLQSPVTRFARVLAALPQGLVVVLDQIRQKQETGASGPAV
ncbi:MAG TPA: 50S ribosomal protein L10 [Thermoanaerobaculia bacterium]|nr:50S ribosomal protein L10 [Thermoanaerobaculia bacterium]